MYNVIRNRIVIYITGWEGDEDERPLYIYYYMLLVF